MADLILTLNAGSSSIKFSVYDGDARLFRGQVERIGPNGRLTVKDAQDFEHPVTAPNLSDHSTAVQAILTNILPLLDGRKISAVGHRVVHGGMRFDAPAVLDDETIAYLETLTPFAPLHQPHNLAGIYAARAAFGDVPQIACFDTAFHRHHPFVNDTFAIPREYYDQGVRRYGFHGLSYDYITSEIAKQSPTLAQGRVVIAHLGNGASMCAVRGGRSIASTMGFSALDGLPMGTRCGQIDAGVVLYLMQQENMTADQISDMLYKKSGLLGMSGVSNDMRTLERSDQIGAKQAIDYFVFRIQRELGAMAAVLNGIDALIFCGGIGENSTLIRERVCSGMEWMGIELDHTRNAENTPRISADLSRVTVMTIPTDEEVVIARAVRNLA